MADLPALITRNSDLSGYTPRCHGLPAIDSFVRFIAQRLEPELPSLPTEIAFAVERRGNHVFKLSGDVSFGDDTKPVSGEIVWLPRMDCFRGHVLLDPAGKINRMLAEDAAKCRTQSWTRKDWRDDSADHTHCLLCMATISSVNGDDGFTFGYTTDGREWLCPTCHDLVVIRGHEHPWLAEGR